MSYLSSLWPGAGVPWYVKDGGEKFEWPKKNELKNFTFLCLTCHLRDVALVFHGTWKTAGKILGDRKKINLRILHFCVLTCHLRDVALVFHGTWKTVGKILGDRKKMNLIHVFGCWIGYGKIKIIIIRIMCERKAIAVQAFYIPVSSWGLVVEGQRFHDSRHMKEVWLSAVSTVRHYPPGNIRGSHFGYRLGPLQCPSEDGRIMSMKHFVIISSLRVLF